MSLRALFLSRLRSTLRSPGAMLVLLLALLVPILLGLYSTRESEARLRVAVVDHDQGRLSRRLVEMMNDSGDIVSEEMTEEDALRLMRLDLLQCLFVIRPGFTQRLETLEFSDLIDLTVAPGCAYGASVSEPLINAVMKLWFEEQTLYDVESLRQSGGVRFTPGQSQALRRAMEEAWAHGPQVRIDYVTRQPEAEAPTAVSSVFLCTALRWFAALSLLFLILSGQWVGQYSRPQLQQRLQQTGMRFEAGFLAQSCAQLALVYAGFLAILLLGGDPHTLLNTLLPALVYGAGILGAALAVCAVCRELTSLLLFGPVLGLTAAFLSGLLVELPDWGALWVSVSWLLPGRQFYMALDGGWNALAAAAVSALWLGLGVLAAQLSARQQQKAALTRLDKNQEGSA